MTAPVTQDDRDAAGALIYKLNGCLAADWCASIAAGKCDDYAEVQAFARHRTEAQAKLREALERAERRLRKHRDDTPADDTRDKAKAYAIVFTALRDTQP